MNLLSGSSLRAHLSDAPCVAFGVEGAPVDGAAAEASNALFTGVVPVVRGRMVHQTTISRNCSAHGGPVARQNVSGYQRVKHVALLAALIAAPCLCWILAAVYYPKQTLIGVGALFLALVIYGLAMSFLGARELIAAGASEVEL